MTNPQGGRAATNAVLPHRAEISARLQQTGGQLM
jgi:hypothetical protein